MKTVGFLCLNGSLVPCLFDFFALIPRPVGIGFSGRRHLPEEVTDSGCPPQQVKPESKNETNENHQQKQKEKSSNSGNQPYTDIHGSAASLSGDTRSYLLRDVRQRHALQPDISRTLHRCQKEAFAAEEDVLETLYPCDIEIYGRVHCRQV